MQLGREWFKVIGVMEPRGEVFGQNLDLFMLMPYQTALSFSGAQVRPDFTHHLSWSTIRKRSRT